MTTTPPTNPPDAPESPTGAGTDTGTDTGPRVTRDELRDLGRLRRTTSDRKVAGVAGGLARHLDVDPVLLRVGFVVLAFFGGAGLILYAAGWALLPEDGRDRAPLHLDERSRGIALVALAVLAALSLVGDSWGGNWFPWPLAVIGLVAFVWLSRSRERDARRAAAHHPDGPDGHPTAYAPVPRDPRKRGPVLFWFTLLLVAVAEGVLAIADGAGLPVVDSAYAALAVGLVALMLLVGSVVGRAGGLIALGLVASLALALSTAADRWDGDRVEHRPTSAADVADRYTLGDGSLLLDLTGVSDPEQLDGRTIALTGNAGEIVVRVPEDTDLEMSVDIDGPGGYDLVGRQGGGFSTDTTQTHDGGTDVPSLTIDATLEVGQITVETE